MANTIRGLPAHLATVPDDTIDWLRWREKALAFRELCHRMCDDDPEQRAGIIALAAQDPAFFTLVFGCILEPRDITDYRVNDDGELVSFRKPRGWYPWIPYGFQIETIRFIEGCVSRQDDPTGKGDGVVEKSRDMGATWNFCLYVSHQWLFADDFIAGLFSRKEDLVDSNDPASMFYRIESLLGLNPKVPETTYAPGTIFDGARVRIPDYLIPAGYEAKVHNQKLSLRHPTKTNQIVGESTTSRSGIGTRTSVSIIDEAAKIDNLLEMWSGMGPVTNHRFVLSSADRRYGDGMFILANRAKLAAQDPTRSGASFLSLSWDRHPLRDAGWLERERARYEGDEHGFKREYEIDWDAGMGDWVYPAAKTLIPVDAPFVEVGGGDVYGSIDPGLRDPTSVVFSQHMPVENIYHIFEALELATPNAEYLAPILMGFPPGHQVRAAYPEHALQDVMDFTWNMRKTGRAIRWVGDSYGDNAGGSSRESFYEALFLTSEELSKTYPDLPPVKIIVMTKYDEGARYHRKRKECLASMLPRMRFHDAPRTRFVLEAIQNNRYKSQDEDRIVMNEPNNPAHDWSSHATTACEFLAVMATIMDFQRGPVLKPQKSTPFRRKRDLRPEPAGFKRIAR